MKRNPLLIIASVFIIVGGILFFSTMDDKPAPPSPKTDVRPSGFTPAMLEDNQSDAAQIFIKTCIQCHDLPDPQSHTPEEWPEIVHRMINHLRRRRFFSSKPLFVPGEKKVDQMITFLSRSVVSEKSTKALPRTERSFPNASIGNPKP